VVGTPHLLLCSLPSGSVVLLLLHVCIIGPAAGPEYPVFQGPVTAQRVQLSLYLEAIKAKHGVA
jgi:hypothetical protein